MIIREKRKWAIDAENAILSAFKSGRQDFLVVATPGAGKTDMASAVAQRMKQLRLIDSVIWITTMVNLRTQTIDDAKSFGVQLEENWDELELTTDFDGPIICYAGLTPTKAYWLQKWCAKHRTLVIFDEPHHMADQRENGPEQLFAWGDMALQAFGGAAYRLLMTGTPFRSDRRTIPFCSYEPPPDACVIPDFTYGYAQAIADRYCRPLTFNFLEGNAEFHIDINESGKRNTFTYEQLKGVPEIHRGKVAATLFKSDAGWLWKAISEAKDYITSLRTTGVMPDAACLITASYQPQAIEITTRLRDMVGYDNVTLVVSDDPEKRPRGQKSKIDTFRNGTAPFIVAVRMVSEGVNIPRCIALVLASNLTTELIVRQLAGRVVRVRPDEPYLTGQVWLAPLAPLPEIAQRIEEEVRLGTMMDPRGSGGDPPKPAGIFIPGDSIGTQIEVMASGQEISQQEIAYAKNLLAQTRDAFPPERIALLLRRAGAAIAVSVPQNEVEPRVEFHTKSNSQIRKDCRNQLKRATANTIYAQVGGKSNARREHFRFFRNELNRRIGVSKTAKATNEQLTQMIRIVPSIRLEANL